MAKRKPVTRKPTEKQKAKVKSKLSKVESVEDIENINTAKFSKSELAYFNKVKAGKIRFLKSFRTSDGKYSQLSEQFIKKTVIPLYKSQGGTVKLKSGNNPDLSDRGLRDFIKQNKKAFTEAQETIEQPYYYNPNSIEKPLNNFSGDRIFINDGDGLVQVTKDEAKERIAKLQQQVIEAGGYSFQFLATFKKGFTELVLNLPRLEPKINDEGEKRELTLDEIIELFQDLEGNLIISEKKR